MNAIVLIGLWLTAALGMFALAIAPPDWMPPALRLRLLGVGANLRNLRALARAFRPRILLFAALTATASLQAVHIHADGSREDLGIVSRRVVTTAGVTAIANSFINTFENETFNFHASGTGAGAEAIGQTTLVTETGTRVSGTQSSPSAGVYRSVATISYSSGLAIIEHGLFSASTSGTLLDRSLFGAINVVNGDSIQFTYDLTFTAGG